MGSGIGGLQTILTTINLPFPLGQWWLGVIIFIVCLFIAMYLAYRDLYIKLTIEKPSAIPQKPHKINFNEKLLIGNLNGRMELVHGYGDSVGITDDVSKGIDNEIILTRKCSICQKLRNEKGDSYYHDFGSGM